MSNKNKHTDIQEDNKKGNNAESDTKNLENRDNYIRSEISFEKPDGFSRKDKEKDANDDEINQQSIH